MRVERRLLPGLAALLVASVVAGSAAIAMLPGQGQAPSRMAALPQPLQQEVRARSLRLQALPEEQRRQLRQRIDAWDGLPAAGRGRLREHWQAWSAMPADRRALVRAAARRFMALPAGERQALRDAFAALPADARRGWLLGPFLGPQWPALEPLFMQVPAGEREPLLQVLHAMPPAQLRDLATLAQRTPPQAREALRQRLLVTPPGERGAWLRARLLE